MADLVCLAFDDATAADRALLELTKLQKEFVIKLTDACVVVRPPEGEIQLKQAFPMSQIGAKTGGLSGALWGGLIGLLFLNPLAGMLIGGGVGAASGALAGRYTDYGINDDFIRELGATIKPDSSALFLLVSKVTKDKVIPHLQPFQPRVLQTSLSDEQEQKLREAFATA
jgi:uncharacterized membrane protein